MAASSPHTRSRPNSRSQANGAAMSNSDPPHPRPQSSYFITEAYEAKLRSMKNGALIVAGLQKISRFFGICALTWASVVLLGGFASSLRHLDFYLVSILLLLEAARLSTTQVFSKLLSKSLFREHHRPEEFEFKDLQYFRAYRLDLIGQLSSCLVAIVGFILAAIRFDITRHGHHFTETDESNKSHGNLSLSLYIFYVLVMLNSATAITSGICRPFFRQSKDDSLLYYHDEVYKTAMNVGMPEADEIDIFEFAFKKLASDHIRGIRPRTIKRRNAALIEYMYNSRNGVVVTCEFLKSSDVWKQVVAANLPGFWEKESRIEKQVALFWALQDRLYGAGMVAEAAANSIQCLSKSWAQKPPAQHPFLIPDPSKIGAANMVDTLIDLLLHPIRSTLLFQLRALEGCCRSQQVLKHIYNRSGRNHLAQELQRLIAGGQHAAELSIPEELCLKLKDIIESRSARQTTKMYAANALHALLCFGEELAEDAKQRLKEMVEAKIDPAEFMTPTEDGKQAYLWQDERDMLDTLRESLGLAPYARWQEVRIIGTEDSTPTPRKCLPV